MLQTIQERKVKHTKETKTKVPLPAPVRTTASAPVRTAAPALVQTAVPAPVRTAAPAPLQTAAPAPVRTAGRRGWEAAAYRIIVVFYDLRHKHPKLPTATQLYSSLFSTQLTTAFSRI